MYGHDQLELSQLDGLSRNALAEVARAKRQAEETDERLSARVAELIAEQSRERSRWAVERQQLVRRAEGLAVDLGRTQARLSDRMRTLEMIESQHRHLKSAARRMVTAHEESTGTEPDDACYALRKLLTGG